MTSINSSYNINPLNNVNFRTKTSETQTVSNPLPHQPNVSFRGTEALAAYNYNLINKNNDFNDIRTIEPIETPNDVTKIGGNAIYNSKGELVIVEKNIGEKNAS